MSATVTIFAPRPLSLPVIRSAARGFRVAAHDSPVLCSIESHGAQITVGEVPSEELAQRVAVARAFVMTRCHLSDDRLLSVFEEAAVGYVLHCAPALSGRTAELVVNLTRLCDGVAFDGVAVRDGTGQVLAAGTTSTTEDSTTLDMGSEHSGRFTEPPAAARVLRRVWVLSAVTMRGFLESSSVNSVVEPFARIWAWLDRVGALGELEDAERDLLSTPHGKLTVEQKVIAGWRGEGLGVLAWALHAAAMVDHQTPFDPGAVASSMGFLADVLPAHLRAPQLRSATELEWQRRRLYAIHWRLREFWLRPRPFDFRAYSRTAPQGTFDLIGIPLVDDDLAVAGKPLSQAPRDLAQRSHDMVVERHLAIGWLLGKHYDYSRVDTTV
ncbi:MAG: DUF4272 domain-containing protein [Kofleriaceae bacterium]